MKGNPVSLAANNLPRPGSIPSKDRDGSRKWNAGNTNPLKVANSNKITNTNNVGPVTGDTVDNLLISSVAPNTQAHETTRPNL